MTEEKLEKSKKLHSQIEGYRRLVKHLEEYGNKLPKCISIDFNAIVESSSATLPEHMIPSVLEGLKEHLTKLEKEFEEL